MYVVYYNEKGGVGKSSLCFNMAVKARMMGWNAAAVDLDPQGTLKMLGEKRAQNKELVTLDVMDRERFQKEYEKHDHFFIDTPGADTQNVHDALKFADVVIIPIRLGIAEFHALKYISNIIQNIKKDHNPDLRCFIALNFCMSNAAEKHYDEVDDIIQNTPLFSCYEKDIPRLYSRIVHVTAAASGKSVFEVERRNIKAENEVNKVFNLIFKNEEE